MHLTKTTGCLRPNPRQTHQARLTWLLGFFLLLCCDGRQRSPGRGLGAWSAWPSAWSSSGNCHRLGRAQSDAYRHHLLLSICFCHCDLLFLSLSLDFLQGSVAVRDASTPARGSLCGDASCARVPRPASSARLAQQPVRLDLCAALSTLMATPLHASQEPFSSLFSLVR